MFVICNEQSSPPTLPHSDHSFLPNVFVLFRMQALQYNSLIPYIFTVVHLFLPSLTT